MVELFSVLCCILYGSALSSCCRSLGVVLFVHYNDRSDAKNEMFLQRASVVQIGQSVQNSPKVN
jgi:hypothetical protein